MADIQEARLALLKRILEGEGHASRNQRRAAFDDADLAAPLKALVHKVAAQSRKVADGDITAVRAAGHGEDEIFELVVCAGVGQANRQYEAAMAALDAAVAGSDHAPRDPR